MTFLAAEFEWNFKVLMEKTIKFALIFSRCVCTLANTAFDEFVSSVS